MTKSHKSRVPLLSALFFFVSYLLARMGLRIWVDSDIVRIALAAIPIPFFAWFLWNFVKMQREADELERRIQLEALAFAFPSAIVMLMTLSLFTIAVGVPDENFGLKHAWYFLPLLYFTGLALASRRYR